MTRWSAIKLLHSTPRRTFTVHNFYYTTLRIVYRTEFVFRTNMGMIIMRITMMACRNNGIDIKLQMILIMTIFTCRDLFDCCTDPDRGYCPLRKGSYWIERASTERILLPLFLLCRKSLYCSMTSRSFTNQRPSQHVRNIKQKRKLFSKDGGILTSPRLEFLF